MSGFSDLVPKAQPALLGGGCSAAGTEGATWLWEFSGVTDDNGTAIDLSTGTTGTCKIFDATGTVIATPTFTGAADGSFTIGLDESVTAGLASTGAPGDRSRQCSWQLTIAKGGDTVAVWTANLSPFQIYQAG